MTDLKISQLNAAEALTGAELIECVHDEDLDALFELAATL